MEHELTSLLKEDFLRLYEAFPYWSDLKGARIAITGASGLLGSSLTRGLSFLSKEFSLSLEILGVGRDRTRLLERCKGEVIPVIWDVRVPEGGVLPSVDYMIHGAAITASRQMTQTPADTLDTAYLGTRNLLEAARGQQVRGFVLLSSMEIYGTGCEGAVTEDALGYLPLLSPRSSYPEGKRAAESLCGAYSTQYGLPVRIARLAQTFGAGVPSTEGRVFAQFLKSALAGEDIVLHTKGQSEGNFVYLSDALCAILLLLVKGESGSAYNVCNESAHTTIRGMAKLVAEGFSGGRSRVVIQEQADGIYPPEVKLCLSSARLRALGWSPTFGLYEMYRRMGLDWSEQR